MKYFRIFIASVMGLVLFYLPTLWHGYYEDDFELIGSTFQQWLQNPFRDYGRPLWTLSYLLANMVSTSSYWHHAINLMLFATFGVLCAWIIKKDKLPTIAYLLSFAALCHPAMVWPVSWISQRNDLLLLVFLIPAIGLHQDRSGVIWVILSCWSKAPFLFQNLVFAYSFVRRRQFISATLTILGFLVALYFVWHSYYLWNVANGAHGLYLPKNPGLVMVLSTVLLRGVKILEGIFLTFVPVPAYATEIPFALGVSALLIVLWGYLAFVSVRNWPSVSSDKRHRLAFYACLAISLSLPYAFGSGLRIYVPATLFFFLAIAFIVPDNFQTRVLLGIIISVYLFGSFLNYGPTYTAYHDLQNPVSSQLLQVPANKWNAMRQDIVDQFVRATFTDSLDQ